jgi:hypothetical protein
LSSFFDDANRCPVAGLPAPALRVALPSILVDRVAGGEQGAILPRMTLCRGDIADAAVPVLVVVPPNEPHRPLPGGVEIGEGQTPDQVVAERLTAKPALAQAKPAGRAGPGDIIKAGLIAESAKEVSQPDTPTRTGNDFWLLLIFRHSTVANASPFISMAASSRSGQTSPRQRAPSRPSGSEKTWHLT